MVRGASHGVLNVLSSTLSFSQGDWRPLGGFELVVPTSVLIQLLVAALRVDCKAGKMEWKQGEH